MSYVIYLKDPVTEETAEVPGHLMRGGTYMADYHSESGTFTSALNTEAHLNITYNYGHYYYEVYKEEGIRAIYGKSGLGSIPMLERMIIYLKEKYKINGEWITTKRNRTIKEDIEYEVNEGDTCDYWLDTAANAIKPLYQLIALAKMRPDCIWDGD